MANGTLAASQIEMLSLSGTGIITITPPATNTNRAITLPDAAGAIVVSGTTPSLNGITFPATQVTSADANTLDDYEEGTWTPTVGGTSAYSVQEGQYTKIGNLVYARVRFTISTLGTGSTTTITGLPFASSSSQGSRGGVFGYFQSMAVNVISPVLSLGASATQMKVSGRTTAGTALDEDLAVFGNNTRIDATIVYQV